MRIFYVMVALVAISVAAFYVSCGGEPRIEDRSEPLMTVTAPSASAIDVLTQHNDVGRTGANAKETLLTASGVNAINNANFGELWKLPVDGQVAAQPLYVSNYAVSGQSAKNVLIVATMNNTVYAFDADSSSPQPLWPPYHDAQPFGGGITNNKPTGHNPRLDGIMSTPVIDRNKPVAGKSPGVIYFMELVASGTGSDFVLVEISLFDGTYIASSPPVGTIAALTSAGWSSDVVLNRPGLLLSAGFVYAAFGSRSEPSNYRGWVLRFDASTLQLASPAFFRSTTGPGSAQGGGIWQAGNGLASDAAGNVYFTTGNGNFNPGTYCVDSNGHGFDPGANPNNCGSAIKAQTGAPLITPAKDEDSIVKLDKSLNWIASYAPWGSTDPVGVFGKDFQAIEACDGDFGSAGPVLFTQTTGGGVFHRLVSGGKTGQLFVLDPGAMSGRVALDGTGAMTQAAFQGTLNAYIADPRCYDKGYTFGPHVHGSPVFLHTANVDYLFVWGEKDYPARFTVTSGAVNTSPLRATAAYDSRYTDSLPAQGMPGGALSVSSNGTNLSSAIVWALAPSKGACGANDQCDVSFNDQAGVVTGDLLAFRASDMALLWGTRNFHAAPHAGAPPGAVDLSWGPHLSRPILDYTKFVPPTIANGKVFVATSAFNITVYGLRTLGTSNVTSSFSWTQCTGDVYSGDVDGDGVADVICHHRTGAAQGTVDIAFGANNSSAFPRTTFSQQIFWCYPSVNTPDPRLYVGDFDGDGRADLLCHDFINGNDFIAYSQGGTTAPYDVGTHGSDWLSTGIPGYAWCDGGYSCKNNGHYGQSCADGSGHPSDALCGGATGACQNDYELVPGDYNGDGRTDLICHHTTASTPLLLRPSQPTGDQFQQQSTWSSPFTWCFDNGQAGTSFIPWHDALLAGDVDGDGLDDLLCHRPSDGAKWVAYNKMDRAGPPGSHPSPQFTGGDWFAALNWCDDYDLTGHLLDVLRLGDMDGDGLVDLVCQNHSTGQEWVLYANHVLRGGSPYQQGGWARPGPGWCTGTPGAFPTLLIADIDGDGRKDFVCHDQTTTQNLFAYYPVVGMTQ